MASGKAKEQQAETSSNSLQEIEDFLKPKFSELDTRQNSIM